MSALFQPFSLRELTLENRIVISPMCQYSADHGQATAWHHTHLGALSLSGAGLLMIEATAVSPEGRITNGCLGLWDDATEAALARTLFAIRQNALVPIGMQIAHAGRKASSARPWEGGALLPLDTGGWETMGPSALPQRPEERAPREMTDADLARVRDCLKEVNEYNVPLFIGFNRRFDPQFRRVKTDVQARRIGKPESLLIISRDPSPPPAEYVRVSGGMFRDMTIHDFDMARFIMGEEPVSVYAQGSNLVDPAIGEAGDIDTAFIVLKYASGAMATIVNSRRSSYGYDQRLELHGSEGLLCAGNILENQVQHYGKQGCTSALPEHFFLQRYKSAYAAEWEHFVAVLRGEAVPDCSGDDGERALYLADKALESLRSQREIVL